MQSDSRGRRLGCRCHPPPGAHSSDGAVLRCAVFLSCRAKARTWCSQKVGGQDWINTVTGKCDGCFKIKETVSAITSPAANHNSNNLPPATGGGTS